MTPQQDTTPILCISSIDWDFNWQGHQEIMSAFSAQGRPVLFMENTGVRNPQLKDIPRIRKRLLTWWRSLQGFHREAENLYVFSPLVLPFPYSPFARWVNRWLILSSLKRWMGVMDFHQPILWVFLPTPLSLDLIQAIPHRALVYYCIDSLSDSTPAARRIVASEKSLLTQADLVFVTSQRLRERASQYNPRVHLFPFGVDLRAFEQVSAHVDGPPQEIAAARRPIIGYIGGIHRWVDQELLCRLAQAHRAYSYILVGPVQTRVERLRQEPNILLVGQKPHERLPHYIKYFDVGIIPYRLTEYTNSVYPTKLNEYHAMGKPVVSTPLPEVLAFNRRYDGLVRIGETDGEFSAAIEEALQRDTVTLQERRRAAAQDNGWDRRIEAMQELIVQAVRQRQVLPSEDWAARFKASLRDRRGLLRAGLGIALFLGVVWYTPLMWFVAEPLQIHEQLQRADAIVVFAGGVGESGQAGEGYQERLKQSVELFQEGWAPRILFVSGYTKTFDETTLMKTLAMVLGVPEGTLFTETRVHHTYDYVVRVKEIAAERGWRSLLLVTSPYHSRRSELTFSRNSPELTVIHAPVQGSSYYGDKRKIQWHQIRGILHEYLAIASYWLKGWI